MTKRLFFGLAAMLIASPAAADVIIRNGSGYEITEVYVAPQSMTNWGEDHLGDKTLKKNDTLTLTGVAPGKWDFRLVFREVGGKEEWPCVINGVDLDEQGDDSTFDDATLDQCSENTDEGEEPMTSRRDARSLRVSAPSEALPCSFRRESGAWEPNGSERASEAPAEPSRWPATCWYPRVRR
jgi:hypothetical protein